jgi:hypothetical protein
MVGPRPHYDTIKLFGCRKGKEPPKRDSVWSETMLRGTILQVHAANKIIVIKVDEEQVIQTG